MLEFTYQCNALFDTDVVIRLQMYANTGMLYVYAFGRRREKQAHTCVNNSDNNAVVTYICDMVAET